MRVCVRLIPGRFSMRAKLWTRASGRRGKPRLLVLFPVPKRPKRRRRRRRRCCRHRRRFRRRRWRRRWRGFASIGPKKST